jgi:GNAT superfamily N-acetyltransferase
MATAIRRATPKDAPDVAEVFLASRATMTYLPHLHTDEETRTFIHGVVGESETCVADRDGVIVGFAVIHDGWLHHLYVHPARFNTNTGGRLFEQVCKEHPEGFQLWAFQQNTGARRFYERHGCALVRLTNGADNEEKLPDALYVWPAKITR